MTELDVVVLFDVDNTLLDNDRVIKELEKHVESKVGAADAPPDRTPHVEGP